MNSRRPYAYLLMLLLAVPSSLAACGIAKECPVGTERCECTSGGACDPGLVCLSGRCVADDSTDGEEDTNSSDNGQTNPHQNSSSNNSSTTANQMPDGGGASGLGDNCDKTADCKTGLRCRDYECEADIETEEGCEQMDGNWSLVGGPGEDEPLCIIQCESDDACPSDYVCGEGICVAEGCADTGFACGDAIFFTCVYGQCKIRCENDSDCPRGDQRCEESVAGIDYCREVY